MIALLAGLALAGEWVSVTADDVAILVPAEQQAAAEQALEGFAQIREAANEWRAGSPVAEVNRAAGGEPVRVPADTFEVLQKALEVAALTDGAFDPTWASLWGVWDFRTAFPRVPDPALIEQRVALIGYTRVQLDPQLRTVHLPVEGMRIGLGGIAKGVALDRAAASLRASGVADFSVTYGGQVVVGGTKDGRPWRIGVRDPRGEADESLVVLELSDVSVSTSGDYERYFELDGVRWHHIIDPRTGYPARGVRSASVVAADAALADALSTALVVMGTERGLALAARLPEVEALVVDDRGAVHATNGLAAQLAGR